MAKKFYAVLLPDGTTDVLSSWPHCQKMIKGVKGAVYKGFDDQSQAMQWLESTSRINRQTYAGMEPGLCYVFVDGSYNTKNRRAGWGFVAVADDVVIESDCGITAGMATSRNIDGELEAAMQAMAWAKDKGEKIVIVYDYQGIGAFAHGLWAPGTEISHRYCEFCIENNVLDFVEFQKVKGHTGVKWNEHADALAHKGKLL